ncbi:hypothetical protein [Ornithinimicrobium murale]|uniref:hypothetical protein n=1 Tax=Ornithinimicrobium murale TaxID=1050153 RepID=UPI000E0D2E8A|nr:hypothetical protein [Ornithinimicrobium murale]
MSQQADTLKAIFGEIFEETDNGARERLIETVLTEHHTVFTRLARELMLRFNVNEDWVDDVRQIVRTEAWRYLSRPLKPGFDVPATIPCIRRAARAEVQRMRQSSAYTGISGAVSSRRRESAIAKHRMDLIRTLGWEPDDETLIASYNAKVTTSRGEGAARRQSALASRDDLRPPAITTLDVAVEVAASTDWMAEVEVRGLVVEIVRRCRLEGELVGKLAQAVLGEGLDGLPDGSLEATSAAELDGISPTQVSRAMQHLRAVAVQVVDEWGLSADS